MDINKYYYFGWDEKIIKKHFSHREFNLITTQVATKYISDLFSESNLGPRAWSKAPVMQIMLKGIIETTGLFTYGDFTPRDLLNLLKEMYPILDDYDDDNFEVLFAKIATGYAAI